MSFFNLKPFTSCLNGNFKLPVWNFMLWTVSAFLMVLGMILSVSGLTGLKFEQFEIVFQGISLWWEVLAESTLFLLLLLVVSLSVCSWARFYMSGANLTLFFVLFMGFIVSMVLLIFSNSLLSIFLGWEGLGVTSFLLVIFYQNWSSASGGLLTLLTNRVGDAILLIIMSYFLMVSRFSTLKNGSLLILLLMVAVAITKSAQWPFFSWLPAAMAAPTPVSALVHSSTLVTAGVWIMLRFGQSNLLGLSSWLTLGLLTLGLASFSALVEKDGKKVVALSTLSQLGLMFMALSLSMVLCMFHVITHALSKALLFMMMGNFLHKFYSEQDHRFIYTGESYLSFMMIVVSVLSLVGMAFNSSFYSKELILTTGETIISSSISFLVLLLVVALTFSYCLKLVFTLDSSKKTGLMSSNHISFYENGAPFLISVLTLIFGWIMVWNCQSFMPFTTISSVYLTLPILGISCLFLTENFNLLLISGFSLMSKAKESILVMSSFLKLLLKTLEDTMENVYLSNSLYLSNFIKSPSRLVVIIPSLIVIFTLY